ncbi:hypothetical protein CB1_000475020 [Camelus ferus]|nr:hypothetical protein CB1_000475020 [Camelus ferus]
MARRLLGPQNAAAVFQAQNDSEAQDSPQVSGLPAPDVSWYLNGRPVQSDDFHKMIVSEKGFHSLIFEVVRTSDAGAYACVAKNRAGEATFTVQLDVMAGLQTFSSLQSFWARCESPPFQQTLPHGPWTSLIYPLSACFFRPKMTKHLPSERGGSKQVCPSRSSAGDKRRNSSSALRRCPLQRALSAHARWYLLEPRAPLLKLEVSRRRMSYGARRETIAQPLPARGGGTGVVVQVRHG